VRILGRFGILGILGRLGVLLFLHRLEVSDSLDPAYSLPIESCKILVKLGILDLFPIA
jgi:hypothetical protein